MLKGDDGDFGSVRRVSAAEIEQAVDHQVKALLCQPEIFVGAWLAARAEMPELTEAQVWDALSNLKPLWEELFPAKQAGIVLLVERIQIGTDAADIRLRVDGLSRLVRDLGSGADICVASWKRTLKPNASVVRLSED